MVVGHELVRFVGGDNDRMKVMLTWRGGPATMARRSSSRTACGTSATTTTW